MAGSCKAGDHDFGRPAKDSFLSNLLPSITAVWTGHVSVRTTPLLPSTPIMQGTQNGLGGEGDYLPRRTSLSGMPGGGPSGDPLMTGAGPNVLVSKLGATGGKFGEELPLPG